jgi:DUF1365 family protein
LDARSLKAGVLANLPLSAKPLPKSLNSNRLIYWMLDLDAGETLSKELRLLERFFAFRAVRTGAARPGKS